MFKKIFLSIALYLLTASAFEAFAQLIPGTSEESNEAVAPEFPADSLGRRTPKGTVSGFMQAVADQNYQRASQYLDLKSRLRNKPEERLRIVNNIQKLLDQGGNILPYAFISEEMTGRTDDDLPPGVDLIGTVTIEDENINLFVENRQAPDDAALWKISASTVTALAAINTDAPLLLDKIVPDFLADVYLAGVALGHWIALLLLIGVAYITSWGVISIIEFIIRKLWARARTEPTAGIIVALALPFRLYLAVWVFVVLSQEIGLSIILRQRFSGITIVIGIIALLILLWRLTDYISIYSKARMSRRGRISAISVILFLRRAVKIAIVIFGIIAILSTFGFDVTTGLAALGIGGIALALGAQKTVENFVGSVTLIADQPIRVGDFCRVGETVGTVEQIGMRSTRIRTEERTVVTIPNGEFSSTRIENFAPRDRFLFSTQLDLRYETTPDQVRYLLVELRTLLYSHPKVNPDPARVRFIELASSSLKISIYTYIDAKDYNNFLEVREDLLLRIMDIVASSGTDFAFPSQTLYFARDKGLSEDISMEAEAKVKGWRENNEMQIPYYDPERAANLKGSIHYPSEGSYNPDDKSKDKK